MLGFILSGMLQFAAPAAHAAPVPGPPPVVLDAIDATLAPGASGNVGVQMEIGAGYHVYVDMLDVKLVAAGGLDVSAPVYPAGEQVPDPAAPGQTREQYQGAARVQLAVAVPRTAAAGSSHAVQLHVRYQACTKDLCTMPVEEDLTALVTVPKPSGALWVPAPVALLEWVASARAEEPPPPEEKAVIFSAGPPADDRVVVHCDLQGEWHMNKMFVGASLPTPGALSLGDPLFPAAHASGKVEDGSYREDFTEDFDLIVPITGPAGDASVEVEVGYQACKGVELCRMPTSEKITVPVHLTGAALPAPVPAPAALPPAAAPAPVQAAAPAPVAPTAAAAPAAGSGSAFDQAQKKGFFALVLLCFLAGIGVSFTPCVLPMVPITMGMIGARGASSKVESLFFTSAYVLGLASVYTALGVFAGVTGELFGSWLQSPYVVAGIALFFVAMGASMFGFFDVQLPAALAGRIQSGERKGGYAGAFFVGMIGAVVAGPCSGPVVVSILALIGTGGVQLGAALMFSFSLGIGMIFLVTGMASGWLPSRGPWMVVVKKSFGIVMWLGAVYYAAPQLPVAVTALATSAVCIVTGVFSWPSEEDGEGWLIQRLRQTWTVVAVTVGVWLLVGLMMTKGFILPPVQLGSAAAANAGPRIAWLTTEEAGLAAAKASGKPLIIDFTAEWCAACHEMEKLTYTDGAVIAEADGFVTVMIDCTEKADPAVRAVQQKYGVMGLPTVVFVKPGGEKMTETVGFVEAAEFVKVMQAARAQAAG